MGEYYYSQIIESKDGNLIPLCKNKTGQEVALHSKYNPIREADGFSANVDHSCFFFVILGLAGGYHIQKLLEKCPKAKIIAVETSQVSLDFLSVIPCVKILSADKRVSLTSIENLEQILLSKYKPAIHGNLTILSLRQWENVFSDAAQLARDKITKTIKLLASDFSAQSHFGKIWQKNILSNLSIAEKTKLYKEIQKLSETNRLQNDLAMQKTAAIIAAGPSLNEKITLLKENREKYFIIATDTAFSALKKRKIEIDAVVSIDGQMVSHQHYMEGFSKNTLYVFDLCANSSAVRKAVENSQNVILAETGHPLAQYASFFSGKQNFIHLEAGSGTVTIAAASFAKSLGFKHIEFFGADFSYIDGLPYVRGTYLENQFYSKSNRLCPAEKSYSALMYRTPVKKISGNKITTEILEAYKNSLSDFMAQKQDDTNEKACCGQFVLKDFKSQYCKDLRNTFKSEDDIDEDSFAFTTLLPLMAKLGKGAAFLAYLNVLRYTERI